MGVHDNDWTQRRSRALASPERRRLLDLLTEDGAAARDVHALAEALDRHVNTVRAHLAVLEEAGLVTSERESRTSPGRPRRLYRATAGATSAGSDGHAALVDVLARQLAASSDDPAGDAELAGRAWGQRLARSSSSVTEGREAVVDLLDGFGFEPEFVDDSSTGSRVLLRHCPFVDVARDHPTVVCSIHLGMLRGFSRQRDGDVDVTGLEPFVEPDLCVAHLRTRPVASTA